MELPKLKFNPPKMEPTTLNWKGLNNMPTISPGELSAMTNASLKYLPCITPRPPRELINTLTNATALSVAEGKFCCVDGTNFVYDGAIKGVVTAGSKSIVVFNGKILIFPDKKCYDIDTGVFSDIAAGIYPTNPISCPDIDVAFVFNNRVFGLKGNNVYATALGEYNKWADFSGENTDSWAADVATDGEFNGIVELQGHLVCTKKNCFYELYGSKPSNFNLQLVSPDIGCIDGKSLVVIRNMLYFLSYDGVYAYSGSAPQNLSTNLNENYVSGKSGTDGEKYYISLFNGSAYNLYVFDGNWAREDDLHVREFAKLNEYLYALTFDSNVLKFNSGTETVNFSVETERFTENYKGANIHSELSVMVETKGPAVLRVYYSLDGGSYVHADTILSSGYYSYTSYIKPKRCNSFQVKFEGFGDVKIYPMTRRMYVGSAVPIIGYRAMDWLSIESMAWEQLEILTWGEINHRR